MKTACLADAVLRHIGLERTVHGCNGLFAAILPGEGIDGFLQFGHAKCLAVLHLHLQAAHIAYAGDCRRNKGKALRLLNLNIRLPVEALYNGCCRFALFLAPAPILEYHKDACGIALAAAVHYVEAADADVGLYLGVGGDYLLYLGGDGLGARE